GVGTPRGGGPGTRGMPAARRRRRGAGGPRPPPPLPREPPRLGELRRAIGGDRGARLGQPPPSQGPDVAGRSEEAGVAGDAAPPPPVAVMNLAANDSGRKPRVGDPELGRHRALGCVPPLGPRA